MGGSAGTQTLESDAHGCESQLSVSLCDLGAVLRFSEASGHHLLKGSHSMCLGRWLGD